MLEMLLQSRKSSRKLALWDCLLLITVCVVVALDVLLAINSWILSMNLNFYEAIRQPVTACAASYHYLDSIDCLTVCSSFAMAKIQPSISYCICCNFTVRRLRVLRGLLSCNAFKSSLSLLQQTENSGLECLPWWQIWLSWFYWRFSGICSQASLRAKNLIWETLVGPTQLASILCNKVVLQVTEIALQS